MSENNSVVFPKNLTFDFAAAKKDNMIGKRLAEARQQRGVSQAQLSKMVAKYGLKVGPGGISKWENGDCIPNIYHLTAICLALEIEAGPSFFSDAYKKAPLLNEQGLKKVEAYKQDLIASGLYRPLQAIPDNGIRYITMPVSAMSVSAGTGFFLDEEKFEQIEVPEGSVPSGADFGLRVCGDSMEPAYSDGQLVWVKKCQELAIGEVGIFLYDGGGYLKVYDEQQPEEDIAEEFTDSYGKIRPQPVLRSYNRKYPPRPILPGLDFMIVGKVLK